MEWAVVVLQILLGLLFSISGLAKISGIKMHVEVFNHLRLPQWFRIVTGIIEFLSAASVLVGIWQTSWAAVGSFSLAIVAVGGVIAHIRVKDSFKQTFPILLFGIIAVFIGIQYYSELTNLLGIN